MTKKILAKFKVDSVELFENGKTLKLSPVYGKVGDNEDFYKAVNIIKIIDEKAKIASIINTSNKHIKKNQ